jgi:L-asparaginase
MTTLFSEISKPPVLLVHGGAGPLEPDAELRRRRSEFLLELAESAFPEILQGQPAVAAAAGVVERLEASPLFNAGLGSALQSDGLARLSAALMDGERQKFSGVLLATHLLHPIRLALALQEREESVLGPLGAQLLARELGIPPANPATPERVAQWAALLRRAVPPEGSGTVGAVVLDAEGRLAAATSTGGGRGNGPERVSDSATVAGTYASLFAAVGCTGIGEEIVDDGLAVRLETRVRDGLSMVKASELAYREALARRRRYGWIGVDRRGAWALCRTTESMAAVAMSANRPTPIAA